MTPPKESTSAPPKQSAPRDFDDEVDEVIEREPQPPAAKQLPRIKLVTRGTPKSAPKVPQTVPAPSIVPPHLQAPQPAMQGNGPHMPPTVEDDDEDMEEAEPLPQQLQTPSKLAQPAMEPMAVDATPNCAHDHRPSSRPHPGSIGYDARSCANYYAHGR